MKEKKIDAVKAYFEDTENYLKFDYNLRIRAEEVANMVGDRQFEKALDMPCGTGNISLPLLPNIQHLTLVDVSQNMIRTAQGNTPEQFRKKVTYINKDFYELELPEKEFGLIISIGILAHIDDPVKFVQKIAGLLKPGGHLILQNTDYAHPYSRFIWLYLSLKKLLGKQQYSMNKLSNRQVEHLCRANGLVLQSTFRYNQSFLGFSNLLPNNFKYKFTRSIWGEKGKKRLQRTGSDYIYHFKKLG